MFVWFYCITACVYIYMTHCCHCNLSPCDIKYSKRCVCKLWSCGFVIAKSEQNTTTGQDKMTWLSDWKTFSRHLSCQSVRGVWCCCRWQVNSLGELRAVCFFNSFSVMWQFWGLATDLRNLLAYLIITDYTATKLMTVVEVTDLLFLHQILWKTKRVKKFSDRLIHIKMFLILIANTDICQVAETFVKKNLLYLYLFILSLGLSAVLFVPIFHPQKWNIVESERN